MKNPAFVAADSIKTKLFMEGLEMMAELGTIESAEEFTGHIGTLRMKVRKVEERTSSFNKKQKEYVLSGLAKFAHINGLEYQSKVVFLPNHCVENVVAGELIDFPIHRITSKNSPNGYTFVVEEVLTEEDWDF